MTLDRIVRIIKDFLSRVQAVRRIISTVDCRGGRDRKGPIIDLSRHRASGEIVGRPTLQMIVNESPNLVDKSCAESMWWECFAERVERTHGRSD